MKPLAGSHGAFSDVQVGGSARLGSRDGSTVQYDYAPMTTQGGYAFWKPTYTGSAGLMHVIPSGAQRAAGAELRVPVSIVDVTGEFVHVNNNTRESLDGMQSTNTERLGSAPTSATDAGGPVQSGNQRATAPGNTLAKGVDNQARDSAHVLHELLFRAAIAF